MTLDLHTAEGPGHRPPAGARTATSCSRTSARACWSAGGSAGSSCTRSTRAWSWRASPRSARRARCDQGPGYAAIGSAFGGTWYLNGHADRPPARPTPVYPDYMTGLFTAFGVMAALRHRDATGEGQWIDAALYESAFRVLEYTTDALRPPGRRARARRPAARGLAGRRLRDAGRPLDRLHRARPAPLRAPLRDARPARAPARPALRQRRPSGPKHIPLHPRAGARRGSPRGRSTRRSRRSRRTTSRTRRS